MLYIGSIGIGSSYDSELELYIAATTFIMRYARYSSNFPRGVWFVLNIRKSCAVKTHLYFNITILQLRLDPEDRGGHVG